MSNLNLHSKCDVVFLSLFLSLFSLAPVHKEQAGQVGEICLSVLKYQHYMMELDC